MIYLTYNDQPNGIYYSQVIDVVKYLNSIQNKEKVKLVALISVRKFFENKRKIKEKLPDAIVIPMAPGISRWKWNAFQLSFIAHHDKIMARGPFATSLALQLKQAGRIKKVVFDARGAYKAELNEYNVVSNEIVKSQIAGIEQDVLRRSDAILSVSHALVNYWKSDCGFESQKHVIIPCTLSNDFIFEFPGEYELKNLKREAGFNEEDIVMVYSGSSAGWQSFSLVEEKMTRVMESNTKVKLLWLTHDFNRQSDFVKRFEKRIVTNWLQPKDVRKYLLAADYGILYRENSVTNQVASPVKFAEYLSCGLDVLISNNLGDFSKFVQEQGCGQSGDAEWNLRVLSYEQKKKNHELAMKYLTKENFKKQYLSLLAS